MGSKRIKARALGDLIARAKADGARYFYLKKPNPEQLLDKALEDFSDLPYAVVWYVYRSRFCTGLLDKHIEYAKMHNGTPPDSSKFPRY